MNRPAHLAAHFMVNAVGLLIVAHVLATQLVFRPRGAEQIRRQFQALHLIQNVLLELEPLALVEVAHR